ncbi:MAG: hypothetical protein RSD88_02240 [Anaerovoracaceae bacterium]
MKMVKKSIVLMLGIMLVAGLMGCKGTEAKATEVGTTVESEQSQNDGSAKEMTKKQKEKAKKEEKESKEVKKESKKAKIAKEKKKAAVKKAKKERSKAIGKTAKAGNKKPSGHVLTIKKGSKTKYFTKSDLQRMGISAYKYSFRNKDSSNRQFETFSGVKISTLLSKAGFSGSSMTVISRDGYAKTYSVSELKSSKKAFKKRVGTSANSVPAILTVSGSESFRLCFGQKSSDSNDSGDYNQQDWAKWITTIKIQ